jgi:hypothetical protein
VATLTCCTNTPGDPETETPCFPDQNFYATSKVIFAGKFWTFNFMQYLKMSQKKLFKYFFHKIINMVTNKRVMVNPDGL